MSAGIKTRDEARAELGLGGDATKAGLGKYNHNHDEQGRFATADDAARRGGAAGSSPKPSEPVLAELDNIATDANVDGGTADQAAVQQAHSGLAVADNAPPQPLKPPPADGLTIVNDVPDDAVSLTAGDGTQFYAPPYAEFAKVYADGQAHWQNPVAAYFAIWQYGTHDYQRDNGIFYSAYTTASNYAVGVYMAGAGYSRDAMITIGTFLAGQFSSNAAADTQAPWWTRGWDDATNSVGPLKRSHRN